MGTEDAASQREKEPAGQGAQRGAGYRFFAQGFTGLWLLVSRPYVFMTFWVSYAGLMPRTILDYSNSVLAVDSFKDRNDQIAFWGKVNLCTNTGVALVSL